MTWDDFKNDLRLVGPWTLFGLFGGSANELRNDKGECPITAVANRIQALYDPDLHVSYELDEVSEAAAYLELPQDFEDLIVTVADGHPTADEPFRRELFAACGIEEGG